MKCIYCLRIISLLILLSLHAIYGLTQVCNSSEKLVDTGYPGFLATAMAEHNGILYVIGRSHQNFYEWSIYQYDGENWLQRKRWTAGIMEDAVWYKGELYIGGSFDVNNPIFPNAFGVIRWNPSTNQFRSVGNGVNRYVKDLHVYKNELYVSGPIQSVGNNIPVKGIGKWDGISWDSLSLQKDIQPNQQGATYVYKMTEWNGKLILGGYFDIMGTKNIVQWDGNNWQTFSGFPNGIVDELAVYQNELIMYGSFDSVGGLPRSQFARWNGSSWLNVGHNNSTNAEIHDMLEFKGQLFVIGRGGPSRFRIGNNILFEGIARWDGSNWYNVTGFWWTGFGLAEYKNQLYLAGAFDQSCETPIENIVTLCQNNTCHVITGSVFQDDNSNCTMEAGEFPLGQQWIQIEPSGKLIQTGDSVGFSTILDTGNYTIHVAPNSALYASHCPQNGFSIQLDTASNYGSFDFGLIPAGHIQDLYINMQANPFRPGFTTRIFLDFGNQGTTLQNGYVELFIDPQLSFTTNTSLPYAIQTGNMARWNFSGIPPTQSRRIWVDVSLATNAILGDSLSLVAKVFPIANDVSPMNNVDSTYAIITGSYDPNDKRVIPKGEGLTGNIPQNTSSLTYTIRFQNTGTDTAFTIIIRDEIDSSLDLSTLQTIASSHSYRFIVEEGQRINWTFDNILLPDSNTNEPASHGFVKYSIKLKDNLPIGTRIENEASIYFDFNSPIITNRTVNTLVEPILSIEEGTNPFTLKIWPQPAGNWVNIALNKPLQHVSIQIFDLQGRQHIFLHDLSGKRLRIPVSDLHQGLYFIRILDNSERVVSKKLMIK